jgi:4-hydroxybenzoate polyprenyltransferase
MRTMAGRWPGWWQPLCSLRLRVTSSTIISISISTWHFVFSLLGVAATLFAVGFHKWYLVLANVFCVMLLWLYSTSLKRKLLIGNMVISVLTAWTVLIFFFAFTEPRNAVMANDPQTVKFFRIAFLYAGFAFVISLIREAIKDMEDLEGDARYGCRTLPIVTGIRATKMYVFTWLVVLIALLVILQLYILQFGWWYTIIYCVLLVILPLLMLFLRLRKASKASDFGRLSKWSKWVMLTGIVSMVFFRIYFG